MHLLTLSVSAVIFGSLDEQPFGYRDIYQTPEKELYKDLKEDEYPRYKHYYDYQLWEDNPSTSAKLKTMQPGKDKSLAGATKIRPKPKETPPKKPKKVAFAETESKPHKHMADVKVTLVDPKPQFIHDKALTDLQMALKMREYSYDHPLNVYMTKTVPLHAPPVDKILRVGGTNTPLVSQAVLTPSETRWYQRAYFNLRNILLNRNEECPFPDCEHVYPTAEPEQLEKHLNDVHTATVIRENCPFCDTEWFHQWNRDQRANHFVTNHADILGDKFPSQDQDKNTKAATATHVPPDGEEYWKFCARCGRDHKKLDRKLDRRHHDKICYRGATRDYENDGTHKWEVCAGCGGRFPEGELDKHTAHKPGKHDYAPYCIKCGLTMGKFIQKYRDKHTAECEGYGDEDLGNCPWCGGTVFGNVEEALQHTRECEERPEEAEEVLPPVWYVEAQGEVEEEEGEDGEEEEEEKKVGVITRARGSRT